MTKPGTAPAPPVNDIPIKVALINNSSPSMPGRVGRPSLLQREVFPHRPELPWHEFPTPVKPVEASWSVRSAPRRSGREGNGHERCLADLTSGSTWKLAADGLLDSNSDID